MKERDYLLKIIDQDKILEFVLARTTVAGRGSSSAS